MVEPVRSAHKGPQTRALQRLEFEVLYGGARGGGKTDAGLAWLLYDIGNPKYRALVIRRNADDLSDWIDRARQMYQGTGAEVVGKPAIIRFPSGAIIRTGHLKDEWAYTKYQWHEYHKILIEELTQIPNEESYMRLISSARSTVDGLKPQIFCTTNPWNIWHIWVKKRFVDVALAGDVYIDPISERGRIFIPAKIEDNPTLMEKDPEYVKYLDSLPEDLRNAWRHGSWDVFDTKWAVYGKEVTAVRTEKRLCRNIFEKALPVHTFWDLGVNDSTVIWLVQFYGKEIRVIDCISGDGEGLDYYFELLQRLEIDRGYIYGHHYAPHDIMVKELGTGMTRLEQARKKGIKFKITPNIRVENGISALKMIFPKIWFEEEKCETLVSAMTQYRYKWDERNQYFWKPVHDWTSDFADMLRYLAVNYEKVIKIKESTVDPRKPASVNPRTMKPVWLGKVFWNRFSY